MLNCDIWTKYTVVTKNLSGLCFTIKWHGIPVFHSEYLVIRTFQQDLFIIFHYSLGQCTTSSFSSPQIISITSWFISGLYSNYVAVSSRETDDVYFDSRSSAIGNKELNWHRRENHIENKVTFLHIFSSSFLEEWK